MKKKSILYLAFLGINCTCAAQFTVIYHHLSHKPGIDSSYFNIVEPMNRRQLLSVRKTFAVQKSLFRRTDSVSTAIVTFNITDTTLCLLGDGFGHETVAIPGDTISVFYFGKQKVNGRYMLTSSIPCFWFNDFRYIGSNSHIYALFDSLAYQEGIIHMDIIRYNGQKSLVDFFDTVTHRFRERVAYTTDYCQRYAVPGRIERLALAEIRAAYILNLLDPFRGGVGRIPLSDYPRPYLDTLTNASFNDAVLFFKVCSYSDAAVNYNILFANRMSDMGQEDVNSPDYSFDQIYRKQLARPIKEYLLAFDICRNLKKLSVF